MNGPSEISPTLAEFLHVPYWTKMNEEDIILEIWDYMHKRNLFIDSRTILVDKALTPVLHPHFYWQDNECTTENTVILIFIAKMHLDPDFIEKDVNERLTRIKRNMAARKILRYLKTHRRGDDMLPPNQMWLQYLATHYGHNDVKDVKDGKESNVHYHCYYNGNNGNGWLRGNGFD